MKGRVWDKVRRQVKVLFERAGIISCELKYAGCWNANALSFCHRLKRRKITTEEELAFVILGCIPCHQILEAKPAEEMYQIVTEIREARPV